MSILEKVKALVNYNSQLKQENADLKQKYADALAKDVADEQAIAYAQEAAQSAKDAIAPLQTAIADDASEDEQVSALIDSVLPPVEEPAPIV